MFQHLRFSRFALALSLVSFATAGQAAEIDKLLPDETETVMSINIRQILDSAVVKKNGLEKIKDALKSQDELQTYLKDLGLDPLKDIDNIVIGGAGNTDTEKALLIINGRFNQDKFDAKAVDVAKAKPDSLKIHTEGSTKIYEVSIPNQPQTMFASIVSKNMILAASSKPALLDALDKHSGKKSSKLKNKELQAMVTKVDAKQSFWMILPTSALPPDLLNNDDVKKNLEGVEVITAGVTFSEKVVLKVNIATKDADTAKNMLKQIKNVLRQAQGFLALAGEQMAPLADAIAAIKSTANDKSITLEGELSAEAIEKLMKLADQ